MECLKFIFAKSSYNAQKRRYKYLWPDKGKELTNKIAKDYLDKENVKWYSTESFIKCSFIERFNFKLRSKFKKNILELKDEIFKLHDELIRAIDEYNNTKHFSKTFRPIEIENHEPEIREKLYKKYMNTHKGKVMFKAGDQVRICKYKGTYDKKSGKRFTKDICKIKKINDTRPITYNLVDLDGEDVIGKFYNFVLVSASGKT